MMMWFEISDIEYQFADGTETIQARFKADLTDPRREWWPVWIPEQAGEGPEPGQIGTAYHRYLEWREKGQMLLGRLGVRPGTGENDPPVFQIIGIKTKAPKSDD